MGTPWDAHTYDQSSEPQQAWAVEVLTRLEGIARDAVALDVGCGTGRVTEALLELVPRGRVLVDGSADMVALARRRLADRAEVWCQDVLDLDLDAHGDVIVSTATLHWVSDHDRLWARLARALGPGGMLEVQCGGQANIAGVREVIEAVARDVAPQLVGWSPWVFARPQETQRRLREAGFTAIRCRLQEAPTYPQVPCAPQCLRRSRSEMKGATDRAQTEHVHRAPDPAVDRRPVSMSLMSGQSAEGVLTAVVDERSSRAEREERTLLAYHAGAVQRGRSAADGESTGTALGAEPAAAIDGGMRSVEDHIDARDPAADHRQGCRSCARRPRARGHRPGGGLPDGVFRRGGRARR